MATEEVTPKDLYVTFVLDETGSMGAIKDDAIGGFNEYLRTVKQEREEGQRVSFTLVKFDSMKTEKVHVGEEIAKVPELTHETYRPGAATPLIDACMKAILATEQVVDEQDVNVAFVVLTDGHENASTEFKTIDLLQKVKEKSAAGWMFTFLGADMDAYAQAGQYGFDQSQTVSFGKLHTNAAFAAAASSTMRYASSGDALQGSFTNEERASVGEDEVLQRERASGHSTGGSSLADDLDFKTS
jgi:hypothetical protein